MALSLGTAAGLAKSSTRSVDDDDPPIELVACGSTVTGSAVYTQVGRYCTPSSDPTVSQQDAVNRACSAMLAWINDTHACNYSCAVGQNGCSASSGTAPDPPFTIADCTFTYTSGCSGNPLKTLVTATCTGTVAWGFSCDTCHDQ